MKEAAAITDDPPSGRIHTCDVCGAQGVWSEQWSWWGSMAAEDNGFVVKFCSPTCADTSPEAVWKRKFNKSASDKFFTK